MIYKQYKFSYPSGNQRLPLQTDIGLFYFVFRWIDNIHGGYILDIYNSDNELLIAGIQVVTMHDLLKQYKHIINMELYITSNDGYNIPKIDNSNNFIIIGC